MSIGVRNVLHSFSDCAFLCHFVKKVKGVLLRHVNIGPQVRSLVSYWPLSPADSIVHTLPLYHTHDIYNNALICPFFVGVR